MFAHYMNVCPFICDLVYKHTLTLCICLTEAKSSVPKGLEYLALHREGSILAV